MSAEFTSGSGPASFDQKTSLPASGRDDSGFISRVNQANQKISSFKTDNGRDPTLLDKTLIYGETLITNKETKSLISNVAKDINGFLQSFTYKDGISETSHGIEQENSWSGKSNSFLRTLSQSTLTLGGYTVRFSSSTPLDSFNNSSSLYGNMILGVPPIYTPQTDPQNRTMINTFVKDSSFLSLTPGMPRYNGGSLSLSSLFNGRYYDQTPTAQEAFAYLLKNGIDSSFAQKDKRYYTFEAKYEDYFSYLETMLNTMWIKLGLGTEDGENKFNIFSFFDVNNDKSYSTLQNKYKSSIGFYVNIASRVSESLNSNTYSSGLESSANKAADMYQELNYLTGMGSATGAMGTANAIRRGAGILANTFEIAGQNIFSNLSFKPMEITKFLASTDFSALMQGFSTNGMRVRYPELWESSNYAKNIQFDFNFTSPYGDPLSIFQYVYVPFFSLLAFAMPRQAAENGLVSPFFVRADVPGLITSDLAMITDITFTKGGDQNLWTKDKLPRSVSGSFTITDLYPYLSMVKRLSFLSANPSYTVFLDNMAGLRAIYNDSDRDPLNTYWKQMINRVSGAQNASIENRLWNTYSTERKQVNKEYTSKTRKSISQDINKKAITWLSKL